MASEPVTQQLSTTKKGSETYLTVRCPITMLHSWVKFISKKKKKKKHDAHPKTSHGILELLSYFAITYVAKMLPSSWKNAEYILSTGKKNRTATLVLKRWRRWGLEEGTRMNRLPKGYATSRQKMSCQSEKGVASEFKRL